VKRVAEDEIGRAGAEEAVELAVLHAREVRGEESPLGAPPSPARAEAARSRRARREARARPGGQEVGREEHRAEAGAPHDGLEVGERQVDDVVVARPERAGEAERRQVVPRLAVGREHDGERRHARTLAAEPNVAAARASAGPVSG
jgi:hypothetical protein